MPNIVHRLATILAPYRFGAGASPDTTATMAAVAYSAHGGPDVLQFLERHPRPFPAPGQVLVRILAAGLNPVDLKLRLHSIPRFLVPLPKIPGTDLAGEVVAAPPSSRFHPGARVFGMMPLLGTPWGASAQYVAVEDRFLAAAPTTIDARQAASLPLVSLTVLQGLARFEHAYGHRAAGMRALIHAGSGGVGSFAVQYCRHVLGMEVAATCSAHNTERVRSLGASVVIDHATQAFEDHARDLDLVIDPWGHEQRSLAPGVLRPGGHYVRVASSPLGARAGGWTIPEAAPGRLLEGFAKQSLRNTGARLGLGRCHYTLVFVRPSGVSLGRVARLVEEGLVRPVLDRAFPLAQTAQAHEFMEAGRARGKVVFDIP